MVGISYPGISQLFVGQTQPPHLAAIAPLSVIADTFRSTLYPGGIFNNGFASSVGAGAAERQQALRSGLGARHRRRRRPERRAVRGEPAPPAAEPRHPRS